MAIHVSEKAARQIRNLVAQNQAPGGGLRIGVRGGGCSGLSYTMSFETQQRTGDKVFEYDGVKLFCDMKSYLYLNNMTLDYNDSLMQRGFVFINPNAVKTCGCGSSFSI